MFSNSSGTEGAGTAESVGALLAESLRLMRTEVADCHQRTLLALGRNVIRCHVDDEVFVVAVDAADIMVSAPQGRVSIDVHTSRQTILALIHCRLTLLDAVYSNALGVRGPVRVVEQLSRAMTAYLHGAVRSPSFPGLLARLERPARGAAA